MTHRWLVLIFSCDSWCKIIIKFSTFFLKSNGKFLPISSFLLEGHFLASFHLKTCLIIVSISSSSAKIFHEVHAYTLASSNLPVHQLCGPSWHELFPPNFQLLRKYTANVRLYESCIKKENVFMEFETNTSDGCPTYAI